MRYLATLVTTFTCAALIAQVNVAWSYIHEHGYPFGYVASALEEPDGSFLVGIGYSSDEEFMRTASIQRLSADGVWLEEGLLQSLTNELGGPRLLEDPSSSSTRILLPTYPTQPGGQHGFMHYRLNNSLVVEDERAIPYQVDNVLARCYLWDLAPLPNGETIVGAGMFVGNTLRTNHLWLQRINTQGEVLQERAYQYDPDPIESNINHLQTLALKGDSLWISFSAVRPLGPVGRSKSLRFDLDLEYANDGFALPQPWSTASLDSSQLIYGIAADESGAIYALEVRLSWELNNPNGFDPYRAVLAKYTSSGEVLAQYHHTPNWSDARASRRPVILPDGSILFAYIHNFLVPTVYVAPTTVHLLRLSADLELLDEFIIDGEAGATQQMVQDILVTEDGGVLLYGYLSTASNPEQYMPWVTKLSGVVTGIQDQAKHPRSSLQVFPNPGSTQMQVSLHHQATPGSRLVITDPAGRHVAEQSVQDVRVHFDANGWSSGMYLLSLIDSYGRTLAVARWVKQ